MLNAFFYNLVPAYFDEIREQKQINARYRRKRILEATLQYHLLQWEVAKVKTLLNCNMTLTVLNLHQKTPKGATTKIHKEI